MKRVIFVAFAVLLILSMLLSGCAEEVSREVIDARFTPAHESVETEMKYKFNPLGSETFKLMPDVHTVYHPDLYEVQYRVKYSNGYEQDTWTAVSFPEYKEACRQLGKPIEEGGR